jgi:hypothetical protein
VKQKKNKTKKKKKLKKLVRVLFSLSHFKKRFNFYYLNKLQVRKEEEKKLGEIR